MCLFAEKCEADLPPGANFCPACGAPATKEEAEDISATSAIRQFATGTVEEMKTVGREALKSDIGKKMAAGAALGAVAAAALPFVSAGVGALFGGGYVLFKRITK